jgi:DNA-binding PadR family transcriptional regulator
MQASPLPQAPRRDLTDFEQLVLGLICRTDASGYDLKRRFAATPLGVYQPSSGALYPALRRLQERGLLRVRTTGGAKRSAGGGDRTAGGADRPSRSRRVYTPTVRGRAEHMRWIREPVDARTISRDFRLHVMRFVMMESLLPTAEIVAFLRSLRDALTSFIAELDRYIVAMGGGGHHALLALEHGRAVHEASLAWVERTVALLTRAPAPAGSTRA